jgi:tRNA(Ile)-lysidine synthase
MAASRRSRRPDADALHPVERAVAAAIRDVVPSAGVAIACSGGRDSIALLDAAARVVAGGRLIGFHVHHGLSARADAWASFCRDACAVRGVAFACREVRVDPAGTGVEAAARNARYDALTALAQEHDVASVLLAHHADDQAETLLLQLLRGAGPRGLAAMPAANDARALRWLRPFLSLPRSTIDDYVVARGLAYVDDDSNAHHGFRRNALRAEVIPALRSIAPGYPDTLVRAARHQAESATLLDELAALDAQSSFDGHSLDVRVLGALSDARGRNLLRWFLRRHGVRPPSSARLDEMLRQLGSPRRDALIDFAHDGVRVGLHRGRLHVHRAAPRDFLARWSGAHAVHLPHGTLLFTAAEGRGIARRCLDEYAITIRPGARGERLLLAGRTCTRAVSDLLREAGVPRWERLALPRVHCDDVLAAVPHAGIAARFAAQSGEPGFALAWRPFALL